MADGTTSDRDQFLAFELALDAKVCDEARRESWGRAFLIPSAPLVWDANWVAIEAVGLALDEVVAIADEVLGGAGFAHRTVCPLDEADGRRLGQELEAAPARWPGWEVERTRYMVWRGGEAKATTAVREVKLAQIADLRRTLIGEEAVPGGAAEREATIDQLFELDRRFGDAGGDRWFTAPAEGEPLSCCRLLRDRRMAQVEDVGTLAHARERGYAKAIVLAAVATAQAEGDSPIFLTAEAADWPQLMYAKLGFETVGDLTILRRRP